MAFGQAMGELVPAIRESRESRATRGREACAWR